MPHLKRVGIAALWFAASQFLLPCVALAGAERLEEKTIGRWFLVAMQDSDTGGALCMVSSQNDDGDLLSFMIQRSDHMWTLGLAGSNLQLGKSTRGEGFDIYYAIDNGEEMLYEGIPISTSRVAVPVGRDIAHMEQFRRGNRIEFDTGGQNRSFSLSGSAAALDALSDCAMRHLGFTDSVNAEIPTKITGADAEPQDSYTSVAVGDWFIDALDTDAREFSACYARPKSAVRDFLRFSLDHDGAWNMDVSASTLHLEPSRMQRVQFSIDDRPSLAFQSLAFQQDQFGVEIGGSTGLLDALKNGRRLKVRIGDEDLTYDLVGVGPALDALERCVAHYAPAAALPSPAAETPTEAAGSTLSAATPPQPRAYELEQFGQWTVYAFDAERGFAFCIASAAEQNGVTLVFNVDAKDNWQLALRNDAWQLRKGDTYALQYAIDDEAPVPSDGDAPGSSLVRLELGGSEAIEPFKRGAQLRVMAAKGSFQFDLAGSTQALNAAHACMTRHAKPGQSSASLDPFASTPSQGRNRTIEQRMIGGWTLEAMESANGDSALCSIKRTNDRDVEILVTAMREAHLWVIALEGHGWQLQKNNSYGLAYAVDDQAPVAASGLALSASSLAIPLGKSFIDTNPLRGGRKIEFQTAQGRFSFELDGAAEALDSLEDCANRYLGFADAP